MGGALGAAPVSQTPPEQVSGRASPFDSLFSSAEQKYGLPPGLLKAMAQTESSFNPGAVSPKGARGVMQFMPATAARFGVKDPHDPAQSIDGAARYILELGKRFNGDLTKVVAAYNAGEGAVEKHGGVPPFKETQGYVQRVKSLFGAYGGGAAPAASGAPSVGYNPATGKVFVNGLTFDVEDGKGWVESTKHVGKAGGGLPDGFNPIDKDTYAAKIQEASTPNATIGGMAKSLGKAALETLGAVPQVAVQIAAAPHNLRVDSTKGEVPFEVPNPGTWAAGKLGLDKQTLGNQASLASMTDFQKASITDWDEIKKGWSSASMGGFGHMMAQGFGALLPTLAAGVVSKPLGYIVGAFGAAGQNGDQVKAELLAKPEAAWQGLPEYRELLARGATPELAKEQIATRAQYVAGALSGPVGALDMLIPGASRVGSKAVTSVAKGMALGAGKGALA